MPVLLETINKNFSKFSTLCGTRKLSPWKVLKLRRKLEQAGLGEGGGITTVRQQGYRFSIDNI